MEDPKNREAKTPSGGVKHAINREREAPRGGEVLVPLPVHLVPPGKARVILA